MTDHYRLDDLWIDVPRQQVGREGAVLDVGGLSFRLGWPAAIVCALGEGGER